MARPLAVAVAKQRIFIVDDHPIVRQGMKQLIESAGDLVVCGEAATGDEAVEAVGKLKPQLVVADLSLPGKPGIEVIKDIKARWPEIYILVVSMHEESMYAERVLRAGAMGYVMKQEAQGKILLAIRRILSGQVYVSDRIASRVLRQLTAGGHAQPKSSLELLTDRELEIFHAIGDGKTVRVIAQMLHLSVKTVEAHREHIKNKLQLSSSNELLRMAVQRAMEQ
ncbi:MAG: response regulator transcription factor [Phycisphaerae bacterium]|nr:response regulator transcription factor [Phycisphaerae bacterium]